MKTAVTAALIAALGIASSGCASQVVVGDNNAPMTQLTKGKHSCNRTACYGAADRRALDRKIEATSSPKHPEHCPPKKSEQAAWWRI